MSKRNKNIIKIGIIGIMINMTLSITKIILSLLSNSVVLMADAFNNITDTTSSLITIIGFKLVNKKPTKTYPYGYARYEYISSFLISIFMIIMSIFFILESINKIILKEPLIINNITYLVLLITLSLKIIQFIYYKKQNKKINSVTLKATTLETRNDILTNISIILSMFLYNLFNINIDGYIGLIISIILTYSSIKMFLESLSLLVGKTSNEEIINILNKLQSYKNIKSINNIMIHNYGIGINYIVIHLEINDKLKIKSIFKLIEKIKNDFKKDNYNISVQIENKSK